MSPNLSTCLEGSTNTKIVPEDTIFVFRRKGEGGGGSGEGEEGGGESSTSS